MERPEDFPAVQTYLAQVELGWYLAWNSARTKSLESLPTEGVGIAAYGAGEALIILRPRRLSEEVMDGGDGRAGGRDGAAVPKDGPDKSVSAEETAGAMVEGLAMLRAAGVTELLGLDTTLELAGTRAGLVPRLGNCNISNSAFCRP